ncbi:MAG: phosphoribosylamine--glycine ligase [Candidatus Doudnabacteria bacterium]|nr:phosphoribosylamine--glycine ligase [Candidatus Doudnabacteria bacterium]
MNGNKNGNHKPHKLKFLFVSFEAETGDIAWQIKKEGHEVKFATVSASGNEEVYNGFIDKVKNWKEWVDWSDVIVFDDVDFGVEADKLRKKGKLVVGGSVYTDKLEMDRDFGQEELKKYGVAILPSWNFSNYDEALKFIKDNPGRYVFKPSGGVMSINKDLLFIGEEENGNDLLEILGQNKEVWQKKAPAFILQKFVAGVEVAVGAFFNGKDFILPINVNFEYKRLFPGDIGPFTGDMGSLMFWSDTNYLFRETLEKMLSSLRESGYIGYIDINCIVNGRGIYPLEFTSRFGYPTIHTQLEGILQPASEWLYMLARGESFNLRIKRGFQIGVEIYVPSMLSRDKESVEIYQDLPIFFKKHDNLDSIHIQDVKIEHGVWRIAGESGALLVVTGSGTTVEEARRQVYLRIENILTQNMFYRTDIGSDWKTNGDKLHTWGYII